MQINPRANVRAKTKNRRTGTSSDISVFRKTFLWEKMRLQTSLFPAPNNANYLLGHMTEEWTCSSRSSLLPHNVYASVF